MKSLVMAMAMFAATQVFAGTIELGKYKAEGQGDAAGVNAEFELKAGGAATLDIDAMGTKIACKGTYTTTPDLFTADVSCNHVAASKIKVDIKITDVNKDNVRTGVIVPLQLDLLGGDKLDFKLMKK